MAPLEIRKILVAHAREQGLPWYCQRGQSVTRLAEDAAAGRPVPSWVESALRARLP